MHPILFEIPTPFGAFPIRLYGLMIGIGFLLGIYLASRRARKEGIDPERILDLGMYLLLAAIVGSRALYVLTALQDFTDNPLEVFAIWKGGLVFYGGFLAAAPVGIWYVRKHGLPVWKTADVVAPYLALAHAFGRLGCFFAGCCYGAPTSGPFGIACNDPHSLSPLDVALYPTQLMESGGDLLIFSVLIIFRRRKKFDGQLFWLYLSFYSIMRFTIEFFRGDEIRGVYFGGLVSTSQIIAVLLLGFSLAMLWRLGKRNDRVEAKAALKEKKAGSQP
jgi:phosphatidylglycerol:prolipoprotein diacylglycerol transferase